MVFNATFYHHDMAENSSFFTKLQIYFIIL